MSDSVKEWGDDPRSRHAAVDLPRAARVRVTTKMGDKGPLAQTVELLDGVNTAAEDPEG